MMTQRMLYESGQDGRSVLGMVAVQVEKDPKTGATTIRSVAPLPTPDGAAMATTVFDDGRKSVHAIGGSQGQPSEEELGQILSVIDGVGMKVLLEEVTVTPQKQDDKPTEDREEKVSYVTHRTLVEHDVAVSSGGLDSPATYSLEPQPEVEGCVASGGEEEEGGADENSMVVVREIGAKMVDVEGGWVECKMEEGPVTLTFLGYADATTGQVQSQGVGMGLEEDGGEMLTVERVIITDDGEELKLEPSITPSPVVASSEPETDLPSSTEGPEVTVVAAGDSDPEVTAGEAEKEACQAEVFQDISLEGNGEGVKAQGADNGADNTAVPSRAEGEVAPKRKTCQCCTVM